MTTTRDQRRLYGNVTADPAYKRIRNQARLNAATYQKVSDKRTALLNKAINRRDDLSNAEQNRILAATRRLLMVELAADHAAVWAR